MSEGRLLITAFPPFSNHSKNISQEVLDEIGRQEVGGIRVETQLLSVDEKGSHVVADRIRDGEVFRGIIHLGLAANRKEISLERVARNMISMTEPDNSGRFLNSDKVVSDAPQNLGTTAPIHILDEEFEHDELVVWSSDAGGYVCNETFYRTLHALDEANISDIPTLFVHLPPGEEISVEKQVEKVMLIASAMILRPTYDVVAALLFDEQGRILACKRPSQDAWAGWWEFPGGKVDEGESPSQALSRELEEEIGVSISPCHLVESSTFDYDDRTVRLQIWNCGTIDPNQISLNEHDESRWLTKEELMEVKWLPADLPIISRWLVEGIPN